MISLVRSMQTHAGRADLEPAYCLHSQKSPESMCWLRVSQLECSAGPAHLLDTSDSTHEVHGQLPFCSLPLPPLYRFTNGDLPA